MNTNHSFNLLQNISHINQISALQGIVIENSISKALPKTSKTIHYGPEGTNISVMSDTSFIDIKTASNGSIIGGTLKHYSTNEEGKAIDSSEVNLSKNGTPSIINTIINNRFDVGVFKKILCDMRELSWLGGSLIESGSVKITTTQNENTRSTGNINYNSECVSSGDFTHYAIGGNGVITGYTEIDYGKTKFSGNCITGGYISITSKNENKISKSISNIFLSKLGRVLQIHSSNFKLGTRHVKSKVIADFSNIEFTPRNEFSSGTASYLVSDENGKTIAKTSIKFNNQVPCSAITYNYTENNKINQLIETDYEKAKYNNDLKVIDSTIKSDVYNANEKLISSSIVVYNDLGNPVKKTTYIFNPKIEERVSIIEKDLSNVVFDHRNAPFSGEITQTVTDLKTGKTIKTIKTIEKIANIASTHDDLSVEKKTPSKTKTSIVGNYSTSEVKNAKGKITQTKQSFKRDDGTLYKTVITKVKNDKPKTTQVLLYNTNGTKVNKSYTINLSKVAINKQKEIEGSLIIDGYVRGNVLASKSNIIF